MRADLDADVLVVGGGPAGSVTARLMAQAGWKVILLDRGEFPRSKPCGESINPGAVAQLAELQLLERVLQEPHGYIRGWKILPSRGKPFEGSFPDGFRGVTMRRSDLDATLLRGAIEVGVEVRTGVRVTVPIEHSGRVSGVVTADGARLNASFVVGCDGLRSVIARRLRLIRRPPRLRKAALTAHVTGADLAKGIGELHATRWGCIGIVEVGEEVANVVVVLAGDESDAIGGDPAGAFDRLMSQAGSLRGARRAGDVLATGPFDFPMRKIAVPGAILVGDAAGYYDPFTGQGIYRALKGARAAASALSQALMNPEAEEQHLAHYSQAHREDFGPGRRFQHAVEAVVSRPSLLSPASSLLARADWLTDRFVAVAGDLAPVRSIAFGIHPEAPPIPEVRDAPARDETSEATGFAGRQGKFEG